MSAQSERISRKALDAADDAELNRIADLPPIEYERQRDTLAKDLGLRISVLDKERDRRRRPDATDVGLNLADPEPWPEPVEARALLEAITAELDRYIVMSATSRDAVALWIVLTYCRNSFYVLPLLAIQSPQKRCGKTNVMILLHKMASRALLVSNLSPASLFRIVEKYAPTLSLDGLFPAHGRQPIFLRGLLAIARPTQWRWSKWTSQSAPASLSHRLNA